jgi:hypothetical protein
MIENISGLDKESNNREELALVKVGKVKTNFED